MCMFAFVGADISAVASGASIVEQPTGVTQQNIQAVIQKYIQNQKIDLSKIDWKKLQEEIEDIKNPTSAWLGSAIPAGAIGIFVGILAVILGAAGLFYHDYVRDSKLEKKYSDWRCSSDKSCLGKGVHSALGMLFSQKEQYEYKIGNDTIMEKRTKYSIQSPCVAFVLRPFFCLLAAIVVYLIYRGFYYILQPWQIEMPGLIKQTSLLVPLHDRLLALVQKVFGQKEIAGMSEKLCGATNMHGAAKLGHVIKNNAWCLWLFPAVVTIVIASVCGIALTSLREARVTEKKHLVKKMKKKEEKKVESNEIDQAAYETSAMWSRFGWSPAMAVVGVLVSSLIFPLIIKEIGTLLKQKNMSYNVQLQTFVGMLSQAKDKLSSDDIQFLEQLSKPMTEGQARVMCRVIAMALKTSVDA